MLYKGRSLERKFSNGPLTKEAADELAISSGSLDNRKGMYLIKLLTPL